MNCKEFFNANKEGKKCKLLQEMTEEKLIEWEKEVASVDSPCPVDDLEVLYHQVLNPTNLNDSKDGLSPMSFDTATGVGMSTNRITYTSMDRLVELGRNRARAHNEKFPDNPEPRSLWGFVPIPVATVRLMMSKITNTRGLFVFDTAEPHEISHADICQGTKDQRNIRGIRLELYDIVKGFAFPWPQHEE